MRFVGISRKGPCVHINCEGKRWAKGLCRSHYEKLNRPEWSRGRKALENPLPPAKEKVLLVREQLDFDPDELWEFVKAELGIQGNKMITWTKLPHRQK